MDDSGNLDIGSEWKHDQDQPSQLANPTISPKIKSSESLQKKLKVAKVVKACKRNEKQGEEVHGG